MEASMEASGKGELQQKGGSGMGQKSRAARPRGGCRRRADRTVGLAYGVHMTATADKPQQYR
jgi:hypothetical protein